MNQFAGNRLRRAWCCGVPALSLAATMLVSQIAIAADIQFHAASVNIQARDAQRVSRVLAQLAGQADDSHIVVQLHETATSEEKAAMRANGLELLSYLGNHAYFARIENTADLDALTAAQSIVGASNVAVEWKIDPRVLNKDVPDYVVVGRDADGELLVGIFAAFHADVDLQIDAANVAFAHGAVVRAELDSINAMMLEMPLRNVRALGAEDAVQWIDFPMPVWTEVNDSNRALTGADQAQGAPYNLDGTGVNAFVYDGGSVRTSHQDYGGRAVVIDGTGVSGHATHVMGTVGGDGTASGGLRTGMAPNVGLISAGFEWNGETPFFYEHPGDIEADATNALNNHAADFLTASLGSNAAPNGFSCDITGRYGEASAIIDNIVRGSLGSPYPFIWANGNERQTTRCGNQYDTTAPPACAKNHMTVGSVDSNSDNVSSFSSWGPCIDGRIKPDISGPGCESGGDGGVTSTSSSCDTCYSTLCGTSMATPTVAGLSALIMQDYRANFPGVNDPRGSTLRALFANTAEDRGNVGPDFQYGYGSVRVIPAIELLRLGKIQEDSVSHNETDVYTIDIGPGDEFRATLAWDDPPSTFNTPFALINDLDLVVTSPSNQQFFPWTLDPNNPANAAVQNQADHTNNIEQVYVANPEVGTWTVAIVGTDVPDGPQPYSLVGDGAQLAVTSITLPNGVPSLVAPGEPIVIDVEITAFGQELVPNSEEVHYRYDGGVYITDALADQGGGLYVATLPPPDCGDVVEIYFSAEGTESGTVTNPANAPASVYSAGVGVNFIAVDDNFEIDQGWTEENLGALTGDWQRGVPVDDPGWAYDPASDSDGSGQCYLTQNELGNTDVDEGAVRLTSPIYDMSNTGGFAVLSYDYYLNLTDANGNDRLLVEINTNGGVGAWTQIVAHTANNGLEWTHFEITEPQLADLGVVLSDQTQLRFTANDADDQSIVEAGIDALLVNALSCENNQDLALPNDFTIVRGNQTGGNLNSLFASDNSYLAVAAGITGQAGEPPVWLTIDGVSDLQNPSSLSFIFEVKANTPNLELTMEMFNYDTASFEEVDVVSTGLNDTVFGTDLSGDLSRFIDDGTGAMQAQVSFQPPAITLLYPWTVSMDQAVWQVVE